MKIEIHHNNKLIGSARANSDGNTDDLIRWAKSEAVKLGLKSYSFRFVREGETASARQAEDHRFIQTRDPQI